MHHNRDRPLSEHHRNPHHMSVQCANKSYLHFTALHQLNEVVKKDVSVPLTETFSIVGHLEEMDIRVSKESRFSEETSLKR